MKAKNILEINLYVLLKILFNAYGRLKIIFIFHLFQVGLDYYE